MWSEACKFTHSIYTKCLEGRVVHINCIHWTSLSGLDTQIFGHVLQRRQLLWFPVHFSAHQDSEMGSLLKRMNSFLSEWTLFLERRQKLFWQSYLPRRCFHSSKVKGSMCTELFTQLAKTVFWIDQIDLIL